MGEERVKEIRYNLGDVLEKNNGRFLWGPGRHGAGGNLFTYHLDPAGCVVEYYADLIKIYDEANNAPAPKADVSDDDLPAEAPEKPSGSGGGSPKPVVRRPGSPKPARNANRANGAGTGSATNRCKQAPAKGIKRASRRNARPAP